MELKRPFMIIPLTIIPLTLPSFSLSCSWQLTRHDSNPALTRLHPQSQTWAKLRFDPIDRNTYFLGLTLSLGQPAARCGKETIICDYAGDLYGIDASVYHAG